MRTDTESVSPQLGYILLVTTWLCWGFSYPATSFVLETMDIWSSRLLVMAAAAIVLLALGWSQGAALSVPRSHWPDLIVAALCNMAIFQICMTYGVPAGPRSLFIQCRYGPAYSRYLFWVSV